LFFATSSFSNGFCDKIANKLNGIKHPKVK
jgi:hypothetical protein